MSLNVGLPLFADSEFGKEGTKLVTSESVFACIFSMFFNGNLFLKFGFSQFRHRGKGLGLLRGWDFLNVWPSLHFVVAVVVAGNNGDNCSVDGRGCGGGRFWLGIGGGVACVLGKG